MQRGAAVGRCDLTKRTKRGTRMPSTDRRSDVTEPGAGNLRAGGLWLLGVAVVAGLSSIGAPAQAAFPGINGRLACEGQRNLTVPTPAPPGVSATEIFTVNPDGTAETVLTNNTVRDGDPGFSPDGSLISFESFVDGFSEAYRMASDGSGVTRLTTSGNNEDRGTSWSPDGTKIVFHSTRDPLPAGAPAGSSTFEIYVMNADGSNQVRLTNNLAQDSLPAWSPDGSKIAFTTNRDGGDFEIYTMNPDGTNVVRLTNSPGEDAHPTWSPDGRQIAFHSRRGSTTATPLLEVWRMNADGSNPTPVTTPALPGFKFFPIWSPDGARIAFNGNLDPIDTANTDVYHVNAADGSNPVRVTTAAGFDGRCDWQTVRPPAVQIPGGPAPPPPPPPPVAVPIAPAKGRLTARVTPLRDRRAPYRFTVSGRLVRPAGIGASACSGARVSAQWKTIRGKTVSTRRATMTSSCTYRISVTFRSRGRLAGGRLKVAIRFLGNARLQALPLRQLTARAG